MSCSLNRGRKLLCIALWLIAIAGFFYLWKSKPTSIPEGSVEKIDSLESKIDSIYIVKDSIQERIDTVYIKLEENNKQYEKDFNNVLNNDTSEDLLFFLNYIDSNRTRLDSISKSL